MNIKKNFLILPFLLCSLVSCESAEDKKHSIIKVSSEDEFFSALGRTYTSTKDNFPRIELENDIIFSDELTNDEFYSKMNLSKSDDGRKYLCIDGKNHAIKNLKVSSDDVRGLCESLIFSEEYPNYIKNLVFDDCFLSTATGGGFIAGFIDANVEIDNIHIKNSKITSKNSNVGGLAGEIGAYYVTNNNVDYSANKNLTNCTIENSEVYSYGENAAIGGLVGLYSGLSSNVVNCKNINTRVTGRSDTGAKPYCGGIIGSLSCPSTNLSFIKTSMVRECSNTGTIISVYYAGGIVGHIGNGLNKKYIGQFNFVNCTNTGYVCGEICAGGIIGYNAVTQKSTLIDNCLHDGEVRCDGSSGGGIVGASNGYLNILNCIVGPNSSISTEGGGGIIGFGFKTTINSCKVFGTLLGTSGVAANCLASISNEIDGLFVLIGSNVGLLFGSITEDGFNATNNIVKGEVLADTFPVAFLAKNIGTLSTLNLENVCKFDLSVSGYNEGHLFSSNFTYATLKSNPCEFKFSLIQGSKIKFDRVPIMYLFGTAGYGAGSVSKKANIEVCLNCKVYDNNNCEILCSEYKSLNHSDSSIFFSTL